MDYSKHEMCCDTIKEDDLSIHAGKIANLQANSSSWPFLSLSLKGNFFLAGAKMKRR